MKIKYSVKKIKGINEYFAGNKDLYLVFKTFEEFEFFNTRQVVTFSTDGKFTNSFLKSVWTQNSFKDGMCVHYQWKGNLRWVEFSGKDYFKNHEKITNFKTPDNFL